MSNLLNPYRFSVAGGYDPDWFVITIDTTNTSAGSSSSDQFQLPLNSAGTFSFDVDWGDGNTDTITAYNDADALHTYASSGTYTVIIDGTCEGWAFDNTGDRLKILTVEQWGTNRLCGHIGTNTGFMHGCANLDLSSVADVLDVTYGFDFACSLNDAFRDCSGLTTINNIGSWDITDLVGAFSLTQCFRSSGFDGTGLDSWDFSNVQALNAFMALSGHTQTNYDALLIALDAHVSLQSSVTFSTSAGYTSGGAAATARANIISTYSWTFNDGGAI